MKNNLENFDPKKVKNNLINQYTNYEIPYSILQNNYYNFKNENKKKMGGNKGNKFKINSSMNIKANKINPKNDINNKIKKPFIEREEDWVCFQCKNKTYF